jgi:hypothetical protein
MDRPFEQPGEMKQSNLVSLEGRTVRAKAHRMREMALSILGELLDSPSPPAGNIFSTIFVILRPFIPMIRTELETRLRSLPDEILVQTLDMVEAKLYFVKTGDNQQ